MNFRIAKLSDYSILADIHFECGKVQKGSFMPKLGKSFLKRYYRVFLKEKGSVIVIAENNNGDAVGFSSGSLDASEHIKSLKRNKVLLALSCIPGLIRNPKVLYEIVLRNKFVSSNESGSSYGVKTGARGEYWAWDPKYEKSLGAGLLRDAWINILYDLGCRSFRYELDLENTDINKYVDVFKCEIIEINVLPDGRKRAIVEQKINRSNRTFKK